MMNVRRAGLERFGETAIKANQPMAVIEDVFVPLYLHHRYAVDSAVTVLGGQDYIYAMRGDGRTPTRWMPAAAQRKALDALMSTLKLNELTLSSSLLGKIPPRPPGTRPHARAVSAHDGQHLRSDQPGRRRHRHGGVRPADQRSRRAHGGAARGRSRAARPRGRHRPRRGDGVRSEGRDAV